MTKRSQYAKQTEDCRGSDVHTLSLIRRARDLGLSSQCQRSDEPIAH
jgi:hypothetical protein